MLAKTCQLSGNTLKALAKLIEPRQRFDPGLIHVKTTVDLDLDGVPSAGRPAIALCDVTTGERRVARNHKASAFERLLRQRDGGPHGRRSKPVAKDDFRYPAIHPRGGRERLGRHGMTVEEQGHPELVTRPDQQTLEHGMVGPVDRPDPGLRLGHRELAVIDGGALGHDTRNDTEPGGDPLIKGRTPHATNQSGVQLIRSAIQIKPGPRRGRRKKRCPDRRSARKELVNQRILRSA